MFGKWAISAGAVLLVSCTATQDLSLDGGRDAASDPDGARSDGEVADVQRVGDRRTDPAPDAPMKTTRILSKSLLSFQETYTALARSAQGTLLVAWMGLQIDNTSTMGYSFSPDDGVTWTAPQEVRTPGRDASDHAVAVDAAGNFYLTWLGLPSSATPEQHFADTVYVARAATGSTAFQAPVAISDESLHLLYDRAWITATGTGALLITFNQRPDNRSESSNSISAARSTDGLTWTRTLVATGPGYRNQAYPCGVGESGRLYVLYRGTAEGYLVIRWSDDDGVTWPEANLATVLAQPLHLEFDPTCIVQGNDLWVLFSEGTSDATFANWKSGSIHVVHSGDGGKSFDPPVEARDPAGPPYAQKATIVREASGAIDVVYYAGAANVDPQGSLRFTRSTDRGRSFSSSQVIASVPFTTERGGLRWFGDYMTSLTAPRALLVAYIDASSGIGHAAFARQPLP